MFCSIHGSFVVILTRSLIVIWPCSAHMDARFHLLLVGVWAGPGLISEKEIIFKIA